MRMIPFLRSHSRFTRELDAFVDGELAPREAAGFEAHLARCEQCRAAVAAARTLKADLGALPEQPAPRSFALTPELVARAPARQPAMRTTAPLYLNLARGAAAVSVAAFVAVFTASLANGGDDSTAAGANTAGRDSTFEAKDAAVPQLAATESSGAGSQYGVETPGLAPPGTAGSMSGAGVPSATPQPPKTGANQTPAPGQQTGETNSTAGGSAADTGLKLQPPAPATTSGDSGGIPWTSVFGGIAGVSLGILFVAESRRRRS